MKITTIRYLCSDGGSRSVIRFNNAATTPALPGVLQAVTDFMGHYSAYTRGAGPLARHTAAVVDSALLDIREFLGVCPDQSLLFTQNSSQAINLFARLLELSSSDVVLTSDIEHTSNALPWRQAGVTLVEVKTSLDGALDYEDFAAKVATYGDRLKLVAITGASNMSGYIPDIFRIRSIMAESSALLFVDAAQLAPHRPIRMQTQGIDALCLSAHKLYAPFGVGVLVVPTDLLYRAPVDAGGGSVDMVTEVDVIWSAPSQRHQIGSWNTVGIVALAAACRELTAQGWDAIESHEEFLLRRLHEGLRAIPGLTVFVPNDGHRTAVVPFAIQGWHHDVLAAELADRYGIETRAGAICSHRLVRRWLGVSEVEQREVESRILGGDPSASYGVVRVSLGCYNTQNEVDRFLEVVRKIATPRLGAPWIAQAQVVAFHQKMVDQLVQKGLVTTIPGMPEHVDWALRSVDRPVMYQNQMGYLIVVLSEENQLEVLFHTGNLRSPNNFGFYVRTQHRPWENEVMKKFEEILTRQDPQWQVCHQLHELVLTGVSDGR